MNALPARTIVTDPAITANRQHPARRGVDARLQSRQGHKSARSEVSSAIPILATSISSTTAATSRLRKSSTTFPRTEIVRLPQNMGVVKARNVGLAAILKRPYEFVACLDADDVSLSRSHRQTGRIPRPPSRHRRGRRLGQALAEADGRFLFIERDAGEPAIGASKRSTTIRRSITPTFMVRSDVLKEVGFYSEHYPVAEDYELFRRILQRFPIANIPVVLVDRHLSAKGLSLSRRRRQLWDRLRIQLRYFNAAEADSWLGALKTCCCLLSLSVFS